MVETIIAPISGHSTIEFTYRDEDDFLLEVEDTNNNKTIQIDLDLDAMQDILQSVQALILLHNHTLATKT